MKTSFVRSICVVLCVLIALPACSPTNPLPQPRRVYDPSSVDGSLRSADWDIAVVRYKYYDQGLNYAASGLEPVFIVFKNKSGQTPRVLREEVYGVSASGAEFLPYTTDEATRLVFASENFKQTASNTVKSAALGAAIGAGLGALLAAVTGRDVGEGAAVGGAVLGGVFGTKTAIESEQSVKRITRDELTSYAWREQPMPPQMTKMGYIYLPGGQNMTRVKMTVRGDREIMTYNMPILDGPESPAK